MNGFSFTATCAHCAGLLEPVTASKTFDRVFCTCTECGEGWIVHVAMVHAGRPRARKGGPAPRHNETVEMLAFTGSKKGPRA